MKKYLLLTILFLGIISWGWGQTPVPVASQIGLTYTENFADIANWTNNFASGIGASRWASYPITTGGTANDGIRTTKSSITLQLLALQAECKEEQVILFSCQPVVEQLQKLLQ